MQRCPRCRTSQRSLVRFGVYLCPTCGETDADGVVLAAPPPSADRPSGAAFAAPPPPAWVPPGAPAAPPEPISGGPPRILVVTVSVLVLIQIGGAVVSRNPCSLVLHGAEIGFLLAVLSGKAWARTLGLVSAMLGIMAALFVFAVSARLVDPQLRAFARGWSLGSGLADVYWIYVLFRRDVTAYFARNALVR